MSGAIFLPGVDEARVRAAFARSPGNELLPDAGGVVKFESPESSAALAANVFGWFLDRADRLPPVDGLAAHWPVREVLLEAEMRFPWSGGKHPWLDAALVTGTALVGVESKRYEPFRPKKPGRFSQAYDRPVWGERMAGYCRVRDEINGGRCGYRALDAAQLVKHAFGLRTRTHMGGGRFEGLTPVLLYLYAEPPAWADGRPVPAARKDLHRAEIAAFADAVAGDEVVFAALDYGAMVGSWRQDAALAGHVAAIERAFAPWPTAGARE